MRMRPRRVLLRPDVGVLERLEEPAGAELAVVERRVRRHDGRGADPLRTQLGRRDLRRPRRAPRRPRSAVDIGSARSSTATHASSPSHAVHAMRSPPAGQ